VFFPQWGTAWATQRNTLQKIWLVRHAE
jgi:hypothetical protein